MKVEDFQRAVRALTQITPNDKAVVVAIMHHNGQVVTINTGDADSRRVLYKALNAIPPCAPQVKTFVKVEGEE